MLSPPLPHRIALPFGLALPSFGVLSGLAKMAVRWLSAHTGLPALVVAAILIVVAYRLFKKTARFAIEVALVAALLVVAAAATSAGWLRW